MNAAPAAAITLFIVDDHAFVRLGLRAFFGELDGTEIVGEASNGREALRELEGLAARSVLPDVVLMDLAMPVLDGVGAIEAITRDHPGVRVVALTSYADVDRLRAAISAGAVGYVLKDAGPDDLLTAVEAAHRGLTSIDAALTRKLAEPATHHGVDAADLTTREWEVLELVGQGRSNLQIAAALVVTERTARTHVSHVLSKLGLASRTQAALWFARNERSRSG